MGEYKNELEIVNDDARPRSNVINLLLIDSKNELITRFYLDLV